MNVKELVDLLNTFDEELEVLIHCEECDEDFWTDNTGVREVNKEVIIYI